MSGVCENGECGTCVSACLRGRGNARGPRVDERRCPVSVPHGRGLANGVAVFEKQLGEGAHDRGGCVEHKEAGVAEAGQGGGAEEVEPHHVETQVAQGDMGEGAGQQRVQAAAEEGLERAREVAHHPVLGDAVQVPHAEDSRICADEHVDEPRVARRRARPRRSEQRIFTHHRPPHSVDAAGLPAPLAGSPRGQTRGSTRKCGESAARWRAEMGGRRGTRRKPPCRCAGRKHQAPC